ncbi:MAG: hypothetical protein AAGA48_37330 [Myxococcota bacterium]
MSVHPDRPSLEPLNHTTNLTVSDWVFDWSVIGFVTSTFVPLVGVTLYSPNLLSTPYVAVCAMLGIPTGGLVGWGLHTLGQRLRPGSFRALGFSVFPLVLGLWGATVAMGAAFLVLSTNHIVLAWPMGTVAAMFQTLWLVPTYVWWASDPARRNALRLFVLPAISLVVGVITPFFGMPILSFMRVL